MTRPNESLRLGCVQYLNARPLIHGWPGAVEFDHPSALCRKLAAGELEVALLSSFEFLRHPIYRIVDGVAVGANGPVYSVFVAHTQPIEEVSEILVDPASETSVNLLRCLLAEKKLGARLVGKASEPKQGTAQLLIGDQAIRFRRQHGNDCQFWDLAEEWSRLTSLPFVFALWLVRPEVEGPHALADSLRTLCDRNLAALDDLAALPAEFPPDFCARYFRDHLRFDFGAREQEGLLRFHALCQIHEILPAASLSLRLV